MFEFSRTPRLLAASSALLIAGTVGLAIPDQAHATVYTFALQDHPDGGIAPPNYGLRLDGLLGDNSKEYTFTFSNGLMKLDYDDGNTATGADDTIRIHGTALGGEDTGPGYGMAGITQIDFTYRLNIADPVDLAGAADGATSTTRIQTTADDDASKVPGDWDFNAGNTGIVSLGAGWGAATGQVIRLVDEQGSHPYSFKFNNTDNHRGFGLGSEFSGWGWMNHDGGGNTLDTHVYASDWLFGATFESSGGGTGIPEPATLALFGAGLAGVGFSMRRRRGK